MGLIMLRDDDIELASWTRFHDEDLEKFGRNAAAMLADAEKWARDAGYVIKPKTSFFGSRFSKMTTTYYKEIRVGDGWAGYTPPKKASILKHEIVHAKQWRHYGRGTFGARYIFSARFRWAMEVQAYRESVRAYRTLGAKESWLRTYATKDVPDILWQNYMLGVLRKGDVYEHTAKILLREAA
jgi:hypothetical protein